MISQKWCANSTQTEYNIVIPEIDGEHRSRHFGSDSTLKLCSNNGRLWNEPADDILSNCRLLVDKSIPQWLIQVTNDWLIIHLFYTMVDLLYL